MRASRTLVAVVALASAAPLVMALPSRLCAQQVRVQARSAQPDSARDAKTQNVLRRVQSSNPEDLMRVVQELQARERRLVMQLRASPDDEVLLRRRLVEELSHLNREKFGVLSVVETRCANESGPRPAGYLGLNLETERDRVTNEILFTVVQSLDPGSPADRSGIQPGDTLLMLGGRDVRGRLPDAAGLLEPGATVRVRVARAAAARDFTLEVAPRPSGIARTCGEFEAALQQLRAAPGRFVFDEVRGGEPRRMPVGTGATAGATGGAGGTVTIFSMEHLSSPATPFFAGAQFSALDEDWRGLLNLKPEVKGVFVLQVMPGTLSAQAGLKKGDVVTGVGEAPATSPMGLVNLLIVTERPDATLSVIRGGEKRSVVLRLPPR
jgi:S1-C subfamily serine protease